LEAVFDYCLIGMPHRVLLAAACCKFSIFAPNISSTALLAGQIHTRVGIFLEFSPRGTCPEFCSLAPMLATLAAGSVSMEIDGICLVCQWTG
jgi:hypothetical protein